jgi:hypothetical protein
MKVDHGNSQILYLLRTILVSKFKVRLQKKCFRFVFVSCGRVLSKGHSHLPKQHILPPTHEISVLDRQLLLSRFSKQPTKNARKNGHCDFFVDNKVGEIKYVERHVIEF